MTATKFHDGEIGTHASELLEDYVEQKFIALAACFSNVCFMARSPWIISGLVVFYFMDLLIFQSCGYFCYW